MFKKAILKLEEEMKKNEQNTYVQYVGQYMIEHLGANHIHAENILKEGKTLIGSLKLSCAICPVICPIKIGPPTVLIDMAP